MFVVAIYDVSDNKRRIRLHRKLKNFAEPVQYSAFEAHLSAEQLERMKTTIAGIVRKSEDRVRIYSLCEHCRKRTQLYGKGLLTEARETIFI